MISRFPTRGVAAMLALSTPAAACAQPADSATEDAAAGQAALALSEDDSAAAFTAAGFTFENGVWGGCGDPGTASYVPGAIETVADLNGDGNPEAVIVESSGYCFGAAGQGYSLVSKGSNGWTLLDSGQGMAVFLETTGEGGWPDLMVGGPGFCFPVLRWDGAQYVQYRFEYDDKPCVP